MICILIFRLKFLSIENLPSSLRLYCILCLFLCLFRGERSSDFFRATSRTSRRVHSPLVNNSVISKSIVTKQFINLPAKSRRRSSPLVYSRPAFIRSGTSVPPPPDISFLRGTRKQTHPVRGVGVDKEQVPGPVHRRAQHWTRHRHLA